MAEIFKLTPAEAYEKLTDGASFINIVDHADFSVVEYDVAEVTRLTLLELLEKAESMDKATFYIAGGFDESQGFKAANLLHHQGFENVGYIAGGIQSWFQDGYPVKYNVNDGCGTIDCGSNFDDESYGGCSGCSCGH